MLYYVWQILQNQSKRTENFSPTSVKINLEVEADERSKEMGLGALPSLQTLTSHSPQPKFRVAITKCSL